MALHMIRRIRRIGHNPLLLWALIVAATYGLGGAFAAEPAKAIERTALQQALKAAVLVLVPNERGDLYDSGSGTIMDAEKGLILTNFHVMGDPETGQLFNQDGVAAIGVMPADLRSAPVLRYLARLIGHDVALDLALLQVIGRVDDAAAALPANLGLTTLPRGDSDDLLPGDRLAVIGYPGLGGATVTYTEGVVSGFLDEDLDGEYEWIKTDTEVNPGNSGGLAIDSNGAFVGVPTAGYSRADVAGKISLVRPGSLALRFYDSALLGQSNERKDSGQTAALGRGRGARVSSVTFGDDIDRQNRIETPLTKLPSGATDLYVSFEYSGFRNGQTFAYTWTIDGEPAYDDSFAWRDGSSGVNWLHLYSDEGLPDGLYEITITLDGRPLHTGTVTVGTGEGSGGTAVFGPIVFATEITGEGKPVNSGNTFLDVKTIYAVFPVSNMAKGTPWRTRWLYNGDEVLNEVDGWEADGIQSSWVSLTHPDGLPVGDFALELYIEEGLAQRGQFTVAERRAGVRSSTINVTGVVREMDNSRRTISGAQIVLLEPGVTIQTWVESDFDENLVAASGSSARGGKFQLNAKVTPGERYGLVVVHDEYKPIAIDAYEVPASATDPYELDVTMQRR